MEGLASRHHARRPHAPRVRTLEGTLLAWSAGTGGRTVTGAVVILPEVADSTRLRALAAAGARQVRARLVPQPTCRPDDNWAAVRRLRASFARMMRAAHGRIAAWNAPHARNRLRRRARHRHVRRAWSRRAPPASSPRTGRTAGASTRSSTRTNERAPSLDLSCEDYGLVYRLAENEPGSGAARDAPTPSSSARCRCSTPSREIRGTREAERVRGAVRALRLVGRRLGRDRQRHRHAS